MRISVSLLFLCWSLIAQGVTVYYNLPGESPSSQPESPIGMVLMEQIASAQVSIDFVVYGIRNLDPIIEALKVSQNRGVRIRGVVADKDTQNRDDYDCTERLYGHFVIEDNFGRSEMPPMPKRSQRIPLWFSHRYPLLELRPWRVWLS